MSAPSKHIFIQVDTNSIIGAHSDDKITPEKVREHTIIYDQGSMALGRPVEDFNIFVEDSQDIFFSILPLQLFTYNKVYFTDFKIKASSGFPDIKNKDFGSEHIISFSINTGIQQPQDPNAYVRFELGAVIEFDFGGITIPISILIDPVLRIKQH